MKILWNLLCQYNNIYKKKIKYRRKTWKKKKKTRKKEVAHQNGTVDKQCQNTEWTVSTKKKERDSLNKSTATVHKKIVDRILPPPKKKSIKKKKKRKESCEKEKKGKDSRNQSTIATVLYQQCKYTEWTMLKHCSGIATFYI